MFAREVPPHVRDDLWFSIVATAALPRSLITGPTPQYSFILHADQDYQAIGRLNCELLARRSDLDPISED